MLVRRRLHHRPDRLFASGPNMPTREPERKYSLVHRRLLLRVHAERLLGHLSDGRRCVGHPAQGGRAFQVDLRCCRGRLPCGNCFGSAVAVGRAGGWIRHLLSSRRARCRLRLALAAGGLSPARSTFFLWLAMGAPPPPALASSQMKWDALAKSLGEVWRPLVARATCGLPADPPGPPDLIVGFRIGAAGRNAFPRGAAGARPATGACWQGACIEGKITYISIACRPGKYIGNGRTCLSAIAGVLEAGAIPRQA